MHRRGLLALIGLLVALSLAGVITLGLAVEDPTADELPASLQGDPPPLGLEACAAEPPDDHADPETDVLGWHDGTWYDEPIDVDQSDGLDEAELDVVIDRTIARWEALRCLSFEDTVPVEVIDRATFQEEQGTMNVSEETRVFENVAAKALFMVGEDEDAVELQLENRGESVLGYYDIEAGEIVLISGSGGNLYVDESTLAHELGHALQAQHFGFDDWGENTTDARQAELGLVEGSASFTQRIYEQHCSDGAWADTCLTPPTQSTPQLAHEGLYLLSIYPYSDGAAFARELYAEGGWSAVDTAFETYPDSAKEVTYPDRYPGFTPDDPPLPDRSSDAWIPARSSQTGEVDRFGEPVWFAGFVYPAMQPDGSAVPGVGLAQLFNTGGGQLDPYDYESDVTDGWVGDRVRGFVPADGDPTEPEALAYTAAIAFETEDHATEFVDGYRELVSVYDGELHPTHTVSGEGGLYHIQSGGFEGVYRFVREGTTVHLAHAPTVDALTDVDAEATVTERATATPTPTPTATPTPTERTDTDPTPSPTATDGADGIPGVGLTAAILAVLATALALRRRG